MCPTPLAEEADKEVGHPTSLAEGMNKKVVHPSSLTQGTGKIKSSFYSSDGIIYPVQAGTQAYREYAL